MRSCDNGGQVSRGLTSGVLVAVAVALSVGPTPTARAAPAASPAPEAPEAPAPDPDAAEPDPDEPTPYAAAQRLYEQGRVQFDTADYQAAIDLWTEAYGSVPDAPDAARIKALLIYNIATARERVFDVGRDVQQLRQAKILLEGFQRSIPALYPAEAAEAEAERVRLRLAAVDARLAEVDPEPEAPDPQTASNPADDVPGNAGRGLVIGGSVALGLGAAMLGVMGAGLALGAGANDISGLDPDDIPGRRDQFATGRTGNALAIAGGAVGGALAVTGAVLLGVGVAKRRRIAWGPGPGLVGFGVQGRF